MSQGSSETKNAAFTLPQRLFLASSIFPSSSMRVVKMACVASPTLVPSGMIAPSSSPVSIRGRASFLRGFSTAPSVDPKRSFRVPIHLEWGVSAADCV